MVVAQRRSGKNVDETQEARAKEVVVTRCYRLRSSTHNLAGVFGGSGECSLEKNRDVQSFRDAVHLDICLDTLFPIF